MRLDATIPVATPDGVAVIRENIVLKVTLFMPSAVADAQSVSLRVEAIALLLTLG